jgi:hypothetical protein
MQRKHVWRGIFSLFPPTKTGLEDGMEGDDVVREAIPLPWGFIEKIWTFLPAEGCCCWVMNCG